MKSPQGDFAVCCCGFNRRNLKISNFSRGSLPRRKPATKVAATIAKSTSVDFFSYLKNK
jgi:hypothetical protein